jgi:Cytochrome C oxidase, cbb3-type, subunit III
MNSSDRPKCFNSARKWWCVIACATAILTAATARPASADCPCGKQWPHLICRHGPSHAAGPGDIMNAETGGTWYWVRSPEQEKRVVMNLYNRYCIRCHGVDGRGVWDIPDVPDFTHPVWQTTRSDDYRSRVILEGRGAVMPAFRGTLTLEEACAMARYLHTFAPGTEVSRPDLGTAAATPPVGNPPRTPIQVPPIPAPATSTPGAFNR